MAKKQKKKAAKKPAAQVPRPKDFLDMIAPLAVRFNTDYYIFGNSFRRTLVLRNYPPSTEELALLRRLGEMGDVTIRLTVRRVTAAEEEAILHAATNKTRMEQSDTSNVKRRVTAEAKLNDVINLIETQRRNQEPLVHTSVFLELAAPSLDRLRAMEEAVKTHLLRVKLTADIMNLKQLEGFRAVNPAGHNTLAAFSEQVFPASSAANLYFMNYSGKNDPHGFFIGRDLYGSNITLDLDRRAPDKTNSSVLILGNSGRGKSFLLSLLLCNLLESGKTAVCLDPEHELEPLCNALGGCFADLMTGNYIINPLEPKLWDNGEEDDADAPATFRKKTLMSQHISFLKDFFKAYKSGFSHNHIDTIELMLERLYQQWGINDNTNFSALRPEDYPTLSDLYGVIEHAYQNYEQEVNPLYTQELLREILLGLHSLCRGAESRFFNGHTNITSHRFLVFGVKGIINANAGVRSAMLFNILSYISDQLLTVGNTVATLDELYIWLSNMTTIEYIRNCLKRVRKKQSSMILASQNLEDFDVQGIRELTRPLFAIPCHQFLFHAGSVDRRFYMDNLQLEPSEYELTRISPNGVCLFKCGNERYHLQVQAPEHKKALFKKRGGT